MPFDPTLLFLLNSLAGQSPVGDILILFCASYLPYVVVLGYGAYLLRTGLWRAGATLGWALAAALIARAGVSLIRFIAPRPRPFVDHAVSKLIPIAATVSSFPSGHAAFFFGLATFVFVQDRRVGVILYACAAVISIARIAVGVHYPSDILAGTGVGILGGYVTARFLAPWVRARLRR